MNKNKSILVIDDNEADHIIAHFTLTHYDATIAFYNAYDGQQALDILAVLDTYPDVILLDINMPGMNGHDFLSHYSQIDTIASQIIIWSSSNRSCDREATLQYPFVKDYSIVLELLIPIEPSLSSVDHCNESFKNKQACDLSLAHGIKYSVYKSLLI